MGTRWSSIHLCRANRPISLPFVHLFFNRLVAIYRMFAQVLYIDAKLFVLTNFQASYGPSIRVQEQVLNLLVVNFENWDLHLECSVFSGHCTNALKNLRARNRHDSDISSITDHGVWLSGTSLTVSEKAAVIAIPGVIEHLLSKSFVHYVLIRVFGARWNHNAVIICAEAVMWPKRIVEGKWAFITCVWVKNSAWRAIL